jgi:hypothetical protein
MQPHESVCSITQQLTDDLLLEVVLRLNTALDLCNLSQVSHSFYDLVNREIVWRHLCRSKFQVCLDRSFCNSTAKIYAGTKESWKQFYLKTLSLNSFWAGKCSQVGWEYEI